MIGRDETTPDELADAGLRQAELRTLVRLVDQHRSITGCQRRTLCAGESATRVVAEMDADRRDALLLDAVVVLAALGYGTGRPS